MTGVVAIVQARTGSSRLPRKVLLDLAGEPMLARDVNRISRAGKIDRIVIATTTHPSDDAIVELCRERGWNWFRGHETDLLDRYYRAAGAFQADHVVRITSDCPLIDPGIIDRVIGEYLRHLPGIDYASNVNPVRTFPRGLDTEVMTAAALEKAWYRDRNPLHREHVTQYIVRHPEIFRLHLVRNPVDLSFHRWTVDTPEDLIFVRCIYDHFGNDLFTWEEVLEYLDRHPGVMEMNRHIRQKPVPD